MKASPAAPAAPVGQSLPVPVRPSQILSPPTIRPGTAYNPATAAGASLKALSPLPGSVASNPRFTPAPTEPMQAPGLNTPAGQPGTQQEFFATAPRLLDVAKAVLGRPAGSYGYLDAAGGKSPRIGVPTINVPGATGAYQRRHLWPNQ
ncbi:hypothetical protein ACFZC5_33930 [Nocardia gamkensis]|uniref:hypothetical protein n=1 Tax=Nocardia gamkensis TaxID=352869 RepID=UPI0036E73A57